MTIARLRAVGLSLAEIKTYLTERTPQRMVELYARQEQLIDRQIAQLKEMKGRISGQKHLLRQVIACREEFFCEEQKSCLLVCSEPVVQRDDEAMTAAVGKLMASTGGQASPGTTGMVCRLEDAMHSEAYPFQFYTRAASAGEELCHKKAAGTYLCTYHHGSYETLRESYQRLVSCAEFRGMEPGHWLYAETIVGDWGVWQPEDYIIQVSMSVAGEVSGT